MTVTSDSATLGEKELKTEWPITEGLSGGTTRQKTTSPSLEPEVRLMEEGWGGVG